MSIQTPADTAITATVPAPQPGLLARLFTSHPAGFWFIFWGELAERSSYYGMRAILLLYMVELIFAGMPPDDAKAYASVIMHLFIAACYFLPLVGGYLADNYFGKYWTIVGFSIPYILGHVILGVEQPIFLFTALGLLAMGSGVIKPNISTLMGLTYDKYRPGREKLRSDAFMIFYMAINIGAFLSQASMPWIRTNYSYRIAFLFPAVLMVLAFTLFAAGKPFYAQEKIERRRKSPEERRQQLVVLDRLAGLFLMITFFWMIFDQSTSTWILLAKDHMDLTVFGWKVDPDQVQSVNALLIILLVPFAMLFWRVMGWLGWHARASDKMLIGFVITGLCMAVQAVAAFLAISQGVKVTVWWQLGAFLLLTVAEVLISPVGLELAFTASPKSMKSFVTACFLLTVFLANLLNTLVTPLYPYMHPGVYFSLMAGIMAPVTLIFFFIAQRFNRSGESWKEAAGEERVETAIQAPSGLLSADDARSIQADKKP